MAAFVWCNLVRATVCSTQLFFAHMTLEDITAQYLVDFLGIKNHNLLLVALGVMKSDGTKSVLMKFSAPVEISFNTVRPDTSYDSLCYSLVPLLETNWEFRCNLWSPPHKAKARART